MEMERRHAKTFDELEAEVKELREKARKAEEATKLLAEKAELQKKISHANVEYSKQRFAEEHKLLNRIASVGEGVAETTKKATPGILNKLSNIAEYMTTDEKELARKKSRQRREGEGLITLR